MIKEIVDFQNIAFFDDAVFNDFLFKKVHIWLIVFSFQEHDLCFTHNMQQPISLGIALRMPTGQIVSYMQKY